MTATRTDLAVGFFHNSTTLGLCCPPHRIDIQADTCSVFPTDVVCGSVSNTCDSCGRPLCTPEQFADAQRWFEQYG